MSRFAAIVFSGLAVELARERMEKGTADRGPLAVVIARPGAAKVESSGSRIDEVSVEARAFGVRPGQTVAAARAKTSELRVRIVEHTALRAALVSVADMALSFGATTALEVGHAGLVGDVVWVDITGCGHLHASPNDGDGERTLREAIASAVFAMGRICRVAIADGARVAAAIARFDRTRLIVPPHGNARAIGRLPIAALDAFGLSPDALQWISKIGARKVSDVQRLPRPALAARLGRDAPRIMAALEGDDRAPLRPYAPPEKPVERVVLEYGITHHEALFFVIKRVTDRLAARVAGRAKRVGKLLLVLEVDHGVEGAPTENPTLPITLASPLVKASDLFQVVKAKILSPDGAARVAIEWNENGSGDVPILAVSLEVTEEVAAESVPQHLFIPEARADRTLPRLVAELSAELGSQAVGVLSLANTWITPERSKLVPYGTRAPSSSSLTSDGAEMSRILPVPIRVPRSALSNVRKVSRSEQVEWWKPSPPPHDVFLAFWGAPGGGGSAWVTIDRRTSDAFIHGWVD